MITKACRRACDSLAGDSSDAQASLRSPAVWRAVALLMGLLLLTQLGGETVRTGLRYDRTAIEAGQWWRLLTGHWVHLGWYHWLLNELGLLMLLLLCPRRLGIGRLAGQVGFISLVISLGLYYRLPGLGYYVGLSGVIHGLFVLGLWPQVRNGDWISIGCLLYLIAKLVYEQVAGAAVSDEQAIGGSVITDAHALGAIAAVIYAFIFRNGWRKDAAINKDGI